MDIFALLCSKLKNKKIKIWSAKIWTGNITGWQTRFHWVARYLVSTSREFSAATIVKCEIEIDDIRLFLKKEDENTIDQISCNIKCVKVDENGNPIEIRIFGMQSRDSNDIYPIFD